MNIPFYDDYFNLQNPENERFKDSYIQSHTVDRRIFKFISLTDVEELNINKITLFEKGEFWASHHIYFEDKREIFRKYDLAKVSSETKLKPEAILFFFRAVDETNNISCFTYEMSEAMWKDYANNSNGFCLELEICNSNYFFPVVYVDKDQLDMTDDIILSFKSIKKPFENNASNKMAILPWVLKDSKYFRENELRFLCGDEYADEKGIMGGRVFPGKKEMMGIKGVPYSFEYAGLKLKKVCIGCNCSEASIIISICDAHGIKYEKL